MNLLSLTAGRADRPIATDVAVDSMLAAGAVVAIGVSGGKDSSACALATIAHLDAVGHTGPRVLIHSDLGRVEWRASMGVCERLAHVTGLELLVVRRTAGDMMDRWLSRWAANVERYINLSCVKVILPWSTPSMRFCTSELKTAIICRALKKRYAGRVILSASGIRREESASRKKAPVWARQKKLTNRATDGYDWHPILDWSVADVVALHRARGFDLHEAYTRYGMTRVSCAFCIMSSSADLAASASCAENADIYREMVDLEIVSAFAFQGDRWLGDVAPQLLTETQRALLVHAKVRAAERAAIEATIPDHLLYTKGWPTVMPTAAEAAHLAHVRVEVARLQGFDHMTCLTPATVLLRYEELMDLKNTKAASVDADNN